MVFLEQPEDPTQPKFENSQLEITIKRNVGKSQNQIASIQRIEY